MEHKNSCIVFFYIKCWSLTFKVCDLYNIMFFTTALCVLLSGNVRATSRKCDTSAWERWGYLHQYFRFQTCCSTVTCDLQLFPLSSYRCRLIGMYTLSLWLVPLVTFPSSSAVEQPGARHVQYSERWLSDAVKAVLCDEWVCQQRTENERPRWKRGKLENAPKWLFNRFLDVWLNHTLVFVKLRFLYSPWDE